MHLWQLIVVLLHLKGMLKGIYPDYFLTILKKIIAGKWRQFPKEKKTRFVSRLKCAISRPPLTVKIYPNRYLVLGGRVIRREIHFLGNKIRKR